jgi:hypothetical protein
LTQEDARHVRNPDYVYRTFVGDAVLVPIRRQVADMDCIYTQNAMGALIWQRIEAPATETELQTAVLNGFAAEPRAVVADIGHFLGGMAAANAIQRL